VEAGSQLFTSWSGWRPTIYKLERVEANCLLKLEPVKASYFHNQSRWKPEAVFLRIPEARSKWRLGLSLTTGVQRSSIGLWSGGLAWYINVSGLVTGWWRSEAWAHLWLLVIYNTADGMSELITGEINLEENSSISWHFGLLVQVSVPGIFWIQLLMKGTMYEGDIVINEDWR